METKAESGRLPTFEKNHLVTFDRDFERQAATRELHRQRRLSSGRQVKQDLALEPVQIGPEIVDGGEVTIAESETTRVLLRIEETIDHSPHARHGPAIDGHCQTLSRKAGQTSLEAGQVDLETAVGDRADLLGTREIVRREKHRTGVRHDEGDVLSREPGTAAGTAVET